MVEQHRHNVMADRRIRMAQIAPMDALPVHPLINLRSLGWILVVLVICAFLLGLFAIGAH